MKRATLILLAACGTSDPDIPLPEGPFEPGPISITVTSRGKPAVNVPVIVQNANSDVVASTVTDFDGVATAEITGHGFVTVIEPREVSAPRDILSTFAGVQGGDDLHLDLAPLGPTEVTQFQLRVDLDTSPDALGGHRVLSPCGPVEGFTFLGDPEPPPTTQLLGCGSTTDLLVVSLDELGEPLRSRFHPSVPLTGTQTLMGNFVAVEQEMLEYRNIPAEVAFVGVYRAFARGNGIVFDVSAGVTPDASSTSIKVPVMSGSTTLAASSTFPIADELGTQLVVEWAEADGTDYMLDLGGAMLPRYTALPVFETARRTAVWEEAAGDIEPDAVRIRLQLHRVGIPTGSAWEWRLIGPRTGASITFPQLPIDERSGFNFNPILHDTVSVHELTTASLPTGFDATVRTQGFVPFKDMRSGSSGRIVTQDLIDVEPIMSPSEQ